MITQYCSGYQVEKNERMGKRSYRVLVGKHEGKDHLEDPEVDGRIILRWTFRKWDMEALDGSSWLRIWTGGGHL